MSTDKTALFREVGQLARNVANPLSAAKHMWKGFSPADTIAAGGRGSKELLDAIGNTQKAGNPQKGVLNRLRAGWTRSFGTGTHLDPSASRAGGIRGKAEELSRRGWTGESRTTKYTPIGEKSQTALGLGAGAWETADAASSPDKGVGEAVGSNIGYIGGGLLGAKSGLYGAAATMAAGHYGGRAGRALDNIRSRFSGNGATG